MKLTKDELRNKLTTLCFFPVEQEDLLSKEEEEQILDDYEKARKWEYVADKTGSKLFDGYIDGKKLRELIEKLPIGLILQHIRDSFSEDKSLMSVEAQMKTTKCIEDLMEIQKLLEGNKK